VLSTHFSNPLKAALAIDCALASTESIAWVPSLETDYSRADDESEEGEQGGAWASTSKAGGQAVCQVERKGLRYIAPISADGEPWIGILCEQRRGRLTPWLQSILSLHSPS
jgi:AP-3 complex subunit mu